MKPAIFLDRDGVINVNRSDYVKDWNEFAFGMGVLPSLQRLAQSHFSVVIVSNQSIIGRGLVKAKAVEEIHYRMLGEITRNGGRVDAVYYCPHSPSDNCDCRKPKPGLLFKAAWELGIDLSQSFFIGDAISDVQAALAAGCMPLFVQSSLDREYLRQLGEKEAGVRIFRGLREAIDFVLETNEDGIGEGSFL